MSPKSPSHRLGKEAEAYAAQYLTEKGYIIRARNYRFGKGEIDLIAEKDNFLFFVEVKVRTNLRFGYPEAFVTPKQEENYHEVATYYIEEQKWKGNIRFDIIAITPKGKAWEIVHLKDAF